MLQALFFFNEGFIVCYKFDAKREISTETVCSEKKHKDNLALFLCFCLIIVMSFQDFSLQTSIIFDRQNSWTPWFYRIGYLSIVDNIIVLIFLYIILNVIFRPEKFRFFKPYMVFVFPVCVYLMMGVFYNLLVYQFWKAYLYDLKNALYLFVPYLFLSSVSPKIVHQYFKPLNLLIYFAAGGIIDFIFVFLHGRAEYPSILGIPVLPQIVPLSAIIFLLVFKISRKSQYFGVFFLFYEAVNALNKLRFGFFIGLVNVFLCAVILREFKYRLAAFLVCLVYVFSLISQIILIENPFDWQWLNLKKDGLQTRTIQWENMLLNFENNFPLLLGKGLGATWYEYKSLGDDIYAVGTSMGEDSGQNMLMPVKFVFNFTPSQVLYKWGICGFFVIMFLAVRMYILYHRSRVFPAKLIQSKNAVYFKMLVSIIFFSSVSGFSVWGGQRGCVFLSVLAAFLDTVSYGVRGDTCVDTKR